MLHVNALHTYVHTYIRTISGVPLDIITAEVQVHLLVGQVSQVYMQLDLIWTKLHDLENYYIVHTMSQLAIPCKSSIYFARVWRLVN